MATVWRSRVVTARSAGPSEERVAVGREERRGDQRRRVVAGARRARRSRRSPRRRRRRGGGAAVRGIDGRARGIVRGAADTSLTPVPPRGHIGRSSSAVHSRVLEISVLGPVEVRRDGQPVTVPGGKSAELLVRLALDAGQSSCAPIASSTTCGPADVDTRRNTVQSKVTRLRRALGDPTLIVGSADGYVLAVDPSAVDAFARAATTRRRGPAARRRRPRGRGRAERVGARAVRAASSCRRPATPSGSRRTGPDSTRPGMQLTETHFAARLDLGDGRRRHRRARGRGRRRSRSTRRSGSCSSPRCTGPGARPTRSRPTSGCARVTGRRARPRTRARGCVSSSSRSWSTTPRSGPDAHRARRRPSTRRGQPAVDVGRARRPRRRRRRAARAARSASASSRSSAPAGSARPRSRIAAARAVESRRARRACGSRASRPRRPPTRCTTSLIAAFNVTGGEAALFERHPATTGVLVLDNCEHVVDAAAALAARLLDAAPGLRILCTSQVPLDVDGEVAVELAPLALHDAVELFTRRAARDARTARRPTAATRARAVPLARRAAARDRAGRGAHEDAADRRDHPPPRRPLRGAAATRPAGSPSVAARCGRRSGGATSCSSPTTSAGLWALAAVRGRRSLPAVEFVLEALDVPATAAIDVVGRLAGRSLVIIDDDDAALTVPLPPARQHPRVRARGADRSRAAPTARSRRTRAWFADAAAASTDGVRSSRQGEHLAVARAERANIDAALAWSATHDPRLALEIVNGFGWAWVVLGDSRGAQRIRAALDAVGDAAPVTRPRRARCCSRGGSRRRPVDLDARRASTSPPPTRLADAHR